MIPVFMRNVGCYLFNKVVDNETNGCYIYICNIAFTNIANINIGVF